MSKIIADVSFGILVLMPAGWAFMAAIILLEITVMSRGLTTRWWDWHVAVAATVGNMVSGAAGIAISMLLDGGYWLVVWMPWVSRNEVRLPRQLGIMAVYYVLAFLLSVAIEAPIAQLILRRRFDGRTTCRSCFWANVASYLLGSIALYSWSFGFMK